MSAPRALHSVVSPPGGTPLTDDEARRGTATESLVEFLARAVADQLAATYGSVAPAASPGPETATGHAAERPVLTVAEAAEALGISRALAYELVRRGEIPAVRLGRRIVVPRDALERLLEARSR